MDMFAEVESIFGFTLIAQDSDNADTDELLSIITEVRQQLRADKNWDLADKIRDDLAELDINLEDK